MTTRKIRSLAQPLTQYLDARSRRERLMVLLAATAAIAFIFYALLILPFDRATKRNRVEADGLRSQIAAEADILNRTIAAFEQNSNEGKRRRIAQLEEELRHADHSLQRLDADLVGPRQMVALIRNIVANDSRIKVVSMRNRPPQPLGPESAEIDGSVPNRQSPASDEKETGLYRHGLEITVEGGYWELVHFLHAVESMQWRVLWEDVELKTQTYPKSQLSLVIYTLSTDAVWMEV